MSLTAQDVIDGAADLCNIKQPGESLSATDYIDCRRRLNNFVKLLNNQSLVAAFIAREVWPLVADKGVYTIGPSGDFDTTRPFELEGAALLLSPTISTAFPVTAASVTNGTFTVAGDQTASFTSGSTAVVSGSTADDGNYTVITSTFGVSTVISVAEPVASTTVTGSPTITAFTSDNATVEIPRMVITDDAWQAIQLKALSNSLATAVYFNPSYTRGLAIVQLWPVPDVATNALVLYRRNHLAQFADLATTSYDVPEGFEELLEYGLAERLLTPYAVSNEMVRMDVMRGAKRAMDIVKRTNFKPADMPIDPAWTRSRRGYYNINTGTGGGN